MEPVPRHHGSLAHSDNFLRGDRGINRQLSSLNGFTYLRMGYASALSFVLFAMLFVITIVQVRLQTRWVHYA